MRVDSWGSVSQRSDPPSLALFLSAAASPQLPSFFVFFFHHMFFFFLAPIFTFFIPPPAMSFLFFFLFAASYRAACFCLYLLDTLFGTFFFLRFPALLYIYMYIYIYIYIYTCMWARYTHLYFQSRRVPRYLSSTSAAFCFLFCFLFFWSFVVDDAFLPCVMFDCCVPRQPV